MLSNMCGAAGCEVPAAVACIDRSTCMSKRCFSWLWTLAAVSFHPAQLNLHTTQAAYGIGFLGRSGCWASGHYSRRVQHPIRATAVLSGGARQLHRRAGVDLQPRLEWHHHLYMQLACCSHLFRRCCAVKQSHAHICLHHHDNSCYCWVPV